MPKMLAIAEKVVTEAYRAAIKPDERLLVSDWADRHRVLTSVSSAEPGNYRTDRTPYMREPMDCLSVGSPHTKVVLMFGGQLGKTEGGQNWIGYIVHQAPGPTLMVLPTLTMGKTASKTRLDPLFSDSPVLAERVTAPKSRDSGNTTLRKDFPGGTLVIAGGNSPAGLRSMPYRYLFQDEIDVYPGSAGEEGDPVRLAERGQRTFGSRRKELLTSTPTIEGRSRIAAEYEKSDQRKFYVPCPDCGHKQVLVWANVKYERDDAGEPVRGSERYACEECGVLIREGKKTWMLANGEWRATNGEKSDDVAGFHLSALYSPLGWHSWWDCIENFHDVRDKPEELRVWVNTVLAETWKEKGDAPPWEALYNRRETYKLGTVPEGGVFLTAGVDVQGDRIEAVIIAWGRDREHWSIDHLVFPGDVEASDAPWHELGKLLSTTYPHESGVDMPIRMMAVDSGHCSQSVYWWSRGKPKERVMVVKGRDEQPLVLTAPRQVDINTRGRKISRGALLWSVGVSHIKSEIYGWLRQEQPTHPEETGYPPGYCHFPQHPEEYFKQLTNEQIVPRIVRGYRKYVWEKTGRNEILDCHVYARAAATLVGIDRWTEDHWQEAERDLERTGERPVLKRKKRSGRGDSWVRGGSKRR